jgi:hypothetical protein
MEKQVLARIFRNPVRSRRSEHRAAQKGFNYGAFATQDVANKLKANISVAGNN